MGKHFPRIGRDDFIEILERLGLELRPGKKKGKGDHRTYVGRFNGRFVVMSVDWGSKELDSYYVKQLIAQTGLAKEQVYGLCERTARQAQVEYLEDVPSPA